MIARNNRFYYVRRMPRDQKLKIERIRVRTANARIFTRYMRYKGNTFIRCGFIAPLDYSLITWDTIIAALSVRSYCRANAIA